MPPPMIATRNTSAAMRKIDEKTRRKLVLGFSRFTIRSMVRRPPTVNLSRRDPGSSRVFVLLAVLMAVLVAALALAPGAARAAAAVSVTRPSRERFTVIPFTPAAPAAATARRAVRRAPDPLQAGLPALVAERLTRHPGLRFAGPSALLEKVKLDEALARAAATGTRWVVTGQYEKRPGGRMQVTVEVFSPQDSPGGLAGTPVAPPRAAGQAQAAGPLGDVARTALAAAIDAFGAAGVPLPVESWRGLTAPFSRDPYAFVLFSRGVAEFTGVGARDASAGGVAAGERAIKML